MTIAPAPASSSAPAAVHYVAPDRGTLLFNKVAMRLTRMGLSIRGSRMLVVVGRRSGEARQTVVNPLHHEGAVYLVAPRGTTDWVRNLRAAGGGELRLGRRVEAFRATELADDQKVEVLRAYLRNWAWEVGAFFDGVGADATDDELAAMAHRHPVFLTHPA
ncbi:MAG: nitroreductase family deazaflavin-dependent oxidoreductase [Acidimicrobiales bacterium]